MLSLLVEILEELERINEALRGDSKKKAKPGA